MLSRPLSFCALLLLLATCAQPPAPAVEAQPSEAQPPAPTASPRRFSPTIAAPPALVQAARASADWAQLETQAGSDVGLVWWVRAEQEDAEGEAALSRLAESTHALAPWAGLRMAERLVADVELEPPTDVTSEDAPDADEASSEGGDEESGEDLPSRAQRALELLNGLPEDLPARSRIRRAKARALLATENRAGAIGELQAAVEEAPERSGAASAAMPLAALLVGEGGDENLVEALRLYRRVASRAPKASIGQHARTLSEELLPQIPETLRSALAVIPIEDRFYEAQAYAGSNHHREAEAAYAAIVEALPAEAPRRCEAMLEQGKAILRQRARRRGSAFMADVAAQCEGDERAWARYRAGRAFSRSGEPQAALTQYASLLEESPQHRLADDAHFHSALIQEGREDRRFVEHLTTIVDSYPNGDMRGEAFFRLGMHERRADRHQQALVHFRQGRNVGEDTEDIRGRAAYWYARTLGELGDARRAEALSAYQAVVRAWPLSYYAQQAMARIGELDAALRDSLQAALTDPRDQEALTLPWRDEFEDPRFLRAVALLQVGETDVAADELREMGFFGPGSDRDSVWVAAALFAEAGALPRVTRLVRSRLSSFRRTMPTGAARALWRLAYPRAFAPLIEEKAAEAGVPAAFVRAIAREESSFDPQAESWAHAYGLVQVILPTARRHGRNLGVPINARTLREASTNLAVGTRFMAWLKGRYGHNIALWPSAYNAGHGALDGWLRRNGELDLDAFIEAIPYDETRRYTRRVLQTYGVYSLLDEGILPELPRRVR